MKRSTQQILTTHTGSLPRPEGLRQMLMREHEGRQIDQAEFTHELRSAVADVVKRQAEAGLTVVNDGEYSKYGFSTYVKTRLTGFADVERIYDPNSYDYLPPMERRTAWDFPEFFLNRGHADSLVRTGQTLVRSTQCVGPVTWRNFEAVKQDIEDLLAARDAAGPHVEDVFMSALSPGTILLLIANKHYPSDEEYLQAIADVMRDEYKAIIDAGIVLQLDCPDLAVPRVDGTSRGAQEAHGGVEQHRREMALSIEALNYATRGFPPEQMRMHVCWGSTEHPHHRDPELKDFVDVLLTARPAGMTIVGANGRHEHEWRVWQDVDLPEGKVIIPGVIDSTTNIVEHPQTVAERILRYAGALGKENLIAGVDCGFQTSAGRDQVAPSIAWAKLRSLAEGAQIASRELYSTA